MAVRVGRAEAEEWLDQGGLSPEEVAGNLDDLFRINRRLGGLHSVLAHLRPALARCSGRVTMLDIACGGGDLLRAVAREARARGLAFHGVGLDLRPEVLAYARAHSRGFPELTWVRGDATLLPFPPRSFDLVTCATFLHHLSPEQVSELLAQAAALARARCIIADLVRSRLAALGFRLWSVAARAHAVTRHDGLVSLRRAYTSRELNKLAAAAGLSYGRLRSHRFGRVALVIDPLGN
jgi:SAM-dependent methyltransferase